MAEASIKTQDKIIEAVGYGFDAAVRKGTAAGIAAIEGIISNYTDDEKDQIRSIYAKKIKSQSTILDDKQRITKGDAQVKVYREAANKKQAIVYGKTFDAKGDSLSAIKTVAPKVLTATVVKPKKIPIAVDKPKVLTATVVKPKKIPIAVDKPKVPTAGKTVTETKTYKSTFSSPHAIYKKRLSVGEQAKNAKENKQWLAKNAALTKRLSANTAKLTAKKAPATTVFPPRHMSANRESVAKKIKIAQEALRRPAATVNTATSTAKKTTQVDQIKLFPPTKTDLSKVEREKKTKTPASRSLAFTRAKTK